MSMSVNSGVAALEWLDAAINQVADYRANVGSVLNRFSMTISNLRVTVENLEAARSRIRDADFTTEYAAVYKRRLLQQSGMAMLQKADDQPRMIARLVDSIGRR